MFPISSESADPKKTHFNGQLKSDLNRKHPKIKGNTEMFTFDLAMLRSMFSRCEYAIRKQINIGQDHM